jgi:acyl-CoA-binding protein
MEAEFEKATEDIKKHKPSNEKQLQFYGLYKQVKCGKCNTSCPSYYLDYKGYYKWTAWDKLGKMSKEDAMTEYIRLVREF